MIDESRRDDDSGRITRSSLDDRRNEARERRTRSEAQRHGKRNEGTERRTEITEDRKST